MNVVVGNPAEIRHLLTGPSTRRRSVEGHPAADPIEALDPQSPPSPCPHRLATAPDGALPPPPSNAGLPLRRLMALRPPPHDMGSLPQPLPSDPTSGAALAASDEISPHPPAQKSESGYF
nr:wiskott-Aldrich syndrome protein family member 2-like [Aegilops tauschii subsp. strangulata]